MVPRSPRSRQSLIVADTEFPRPGEIVLMSKGQKATSCSYETAHVVGVAPGHLQKTLTTNEVKILGGLGFDLGVVDEKHAPFDRRHDRQSARQRTAGRQSDRCDKPCRRFQADKRTLDHHRPNLAPQALIDFHCFAATRFSSRNRE